MVVVKAQKISKKAITSDEILCLFVYKFPQYTFAQAKAMPYIRIAKLLKAAGKEDARKMYELMQIVVAPHTKKGNGVAKVLESYKNIIDN